MATTALPARLAYPRPPLDHRHDQLFQEPEYQNGPYPQDEEDALEDPIITP